MIAIRRIAKLTLLSMLHAGLQAQVCDPSVPPGELTASYTPGAGALLQWTPPPGSTGIQVRAVLASGSVISKKFVGFEIDQFLIPDLLISTGTYSWRVQSSCSTAPPLSLSPPSEINTFAVGGSSGPCPDHATDLDGNTYQTVQIGTQCWLVENLRVEHYRDGSAIPTNLNNLAWSNAETGAFAVYDNSATIKSTFGLLYNWYAVADPRGLCPAGWHVPTDAEWTQLTEQLGGAFEAGGKMKSTGTLAEGTGLWREPNADASNSSGFSGLPGGNRNINGNYNRLTQYGRFWSLSEFDSANAIVRRLLFNFGNISTFQNEKQNGYSVRCIMD
jgi:uncharacterized protein (TIGR02145 family)